MRSKSDLFERGKAHIARWCELNAVKAPRVNPRSGKPDFGVCAYYRDGEIEIWVDSCAAIGLVGRQWSYPGYVVDRTPYGVLTSYCPNDNEWFAELFRLFVTNPDLFERVRPRIADLFFGEWPRVAERLRWTAVLEASPRHLAAAENKIRQAVARKRPRQG